MIYFDHNASAPLLPAARDAWLEAVEQYPGNPSSPHRAGARADHALEQARLSLANRLGCHADQLIWTGGATESANHVFHHFAQNAPADQPLWVSAIEHPAVLAAAERSFSGRVERVPVDARGVVDSNWIDTRLQSTRPVAVVVMAANNETGVLQPWSALRDRCRDLGVPFVCDATQWLGRLPADGLGGCDFVFGSGHKCGGPRGVGFLKAPDTGTLEPFIVGGPQEGGRRAGTENLAGILALTAALDWCAERIKSGEVKAREATRETFIQRLREAIPDLVINGGEAPRLWNTVNLSLPAPDCRPRWVVQLDKRGFAVSTGSACSSGNESPSHVLLAMGLPDERISHAIRISGGWLTSATDWTHLANALIELVKHAGAPTTP